MHVVINPSRKILLVEEDTTVIDDGMWDTASAHRMSHREARVSVRHDRGREYGAMGPDYSPDGRGNVVFVDGHCGLVERIECQRDYHTEPLNGG
jgi:prepilin-type processing-associated H-X9-DG protein